jgi:hypothetical protein
MQLQVIGQPMVVAENRRCEMSRKLTRNIILAAMTFAAGTMIAVQAAAEVHFEAVVHTPEISVRVGNSPDGCPIYHHVRPLPDRGRMYRTIKRDLEIARRLSWYTGVPVGELLRYRRYDYTWIEIGQWLHVPGRIVIAAMDHNHWNRFNHEGRQFAEYRDGHRRDHDNGKHRGHDKGHHRDHGNKR